MKSAFLFFVTLIIITTSFTNCAHAKKAEAYLYLNIINEPPKITGMSVYGFADTGLSCNASVEDEHKDKVKLNYYWYKDNVLISNDEILDKSLIREGDKITCKIVPDDRAQLGYPQNVTVNVLAEPINLKFNRITGSIIGNVNSNINKINKNKEVSLIGFLLFLVIILVIANAAVIKDIRKSYSPHRVFGSH